MNNMINLNQLHEHFLDGNKKDPRTGKTTAVMYQIIGFLQVMENTKFFVLTHPQMKRPLSNTLERCLGDNDIEYTKNLTTLRCNTNTIIFSTYEDYMNTNYVYSAQENHFLIWDFGDLTSVNTSIDSMEQIILRNIGMVVGSVAQGVVDGLGISDIDIEINL